MPFFCVVGDDDYNSLLDELKQLGLLVVRTSDFCKREDKVPSLDDLVDCFRTLDIDYRDNKCVVVGLGEYLALRGANFASLVFLEVTVCSVPNVVLSSPTARLSAVAVAIPPVQRHSNPSRLPAMH
jgi:hypothetical protein